MSAIPVWIWVFLGGGLGSLLRWQLSTFNASESSAFPYGTLFANVLACLALGLLLGYHLKHPQADHYKLLAMVGFCGGFSTFSTFSLELYQLLRLGESGIAFIYLGVSLLLGLICVYAGLKMMS